MNLLISLTHKCFSGVFSFDAPQPWQILFQDAATKIMDNITDLHHDIMFFLVLISTFVIYMMIRIVTAYRVSNSNSTASWTLLMINNNNNAALPPVPDELPAGYASGVVTPGVPPTEWELNELIQNDPIAHGATFIHYIPVMEINPNFFAPALFTEPHNLFHNIAPLIMNGSLIRLSTQLVHLHNIPVIPVPFGVYSDATENPLVVMWPFAQNPAIPNPIPVAEWLPVPNPTTAAAVMEGAAAAASAASEYWPFVLHGGFILLVLGKGLWDFCKKEELPKGALDNFHQITASLGSGKPLKYSLPAEDPWKNVSQLDFLRTTNKAGLITGLEIDLIDFSIKLFGFSIKFSTIPFICLTGSLKEPFMALFLALLRRGGMYLVRQQIAGFWKVLLCGKIKNAHFRFFRTTLTKNLSKFRLHSQSIIIKTKVVILQTANQILQVLKKR